MAVWSEIAYNIHQFDQMVLMAGKYIRDDVALPTRRLAKVQL